MTKARRLLSAFAIAVLCGTGGSAAAAEASAIAPVEGKALPAALLGHWLPFSDMANDEMGALDIGVAALRFAKGYHFTYRSAGELLVLGPPDGPHAHRHEHAHEHAHRSASAEEHKAHAPATVSAFVITSSDSRNEGSDQTGRLIRGSLESAGHTLAGHRVVKDDPAALRAALEEALEAGARAVIVNGGTGIGRRDQVIETLRPLFEKELPGFGELFRALSYKEIGSPAMMSRAAAGTIRGAIVFALPGSPQAVRLAMEALILPEIGHAVRELSR